MSVTNITTKGDLTVEVDRNNDVYIVEAPTGTTGSTFSYNLPKITSNGENHTFTRTDNTDNTVTLFAATGDVLCEATSDTGASFSLFQGKSIELNSFNNCWYILYNTSLNPSAQVRFCVSFQGNNGENFLKYTGGILYYMPFQGLSSGDILDNISILTSNDGYTGISFSSSTTLIFEDVLGDIPFEVVNGKRFYRHFLTNAEKTRLPFIKDYLFIDIDLGGLSANIDVYSSVIY